MPSADTVIVDFTALNNAMQSFRQTSNEIGNLASQLKSNASFLQSVWKADASTQYSEKLARLTQNFDNAKTRLDEEGVELNRLYQLEYEAEQQARAIASGVSEYSLG